MSLDPRFLCHRREAVTAQGGDYTCHLVVGVDPDNKLYLLDLWRGQTTPDLWVERMLDMAKLWRPISWAEEGGQIKSSVGPFIEKRMMERKIPLFRKQFPTKHDKSVRAQAIRGKMAMDGLYVPMKASWYAAFAQELLSFPVAKHDDQVDALGLIGQLLTMMLPGTRPPDRKENVYEPDKDPYPPFTDDRQFHSWMRNDDIGSGYDPVIASLDKTL